MLANERIWFWVKIAIVVLVILAVFQLFRVNNEQPTVGPMVVRYTHGSVIEGAVKVPAGNFLSYRIDLNRAVTLRGYFDTMSDGSRIECLVLDEVNFEKWKGLDDFVAISETGHLPTAILNPRIGPGIYHLVFSGRMNPYTDVSFQADFDVD
jgi:hypothetical protein